jgi:hypothetical protein
LAPRTRSEIHAAEVDCTDRALTTGQEVSKKFGVDIKSLNAHVAEIREDYALEIGPEEICAGIAVVSHYVTMIADVNLEVVNVFDCLDEAR